MKVTFPLALWAVALLPMAALAQTGAAKAQPAKPAATFGIGRPATPAEITALDIDVGPDGVGLPP